jgi:hypothetical protein
VRLINIYEPADSTTCTVAMYLEIRKRKYSPAHTLTCPYYRHSLRTGMETRRKWLYTLASEDALRLECNRDQFLMGRVDPVEKRGRPR